MTTVKVCKLCASVFLFDLVWGVPRWRMMIWRFVLVLAASGVSLKISICGRFSVSNTGEMFCKILQLFQYRFVFLLSHFFLIGMAAAPMTLVAAQVAVAVAVLSVERLAMMGESQACVFNLPHKSQDWQRHCHFCPGPVNYRIRNRKNRNSNLD